MIGFYNSRVNISFYQLGSEKSVTGNQCPVVIYELGQATIRTLPSIY